MTYFTRNVRCLGILMLALLTTGIGATAALAQSTPQPNVSPLTVGRAHLFPTRGRAAQLGLAAAATQPNMTYNGGPVMHTSTTYAIFWLPSGASFEGTNGSNASYESLIERYFADVGGTSLYNVLTQYPDSSDPLNSSAFSTAFVDSTGFPGGRGSATNPLLDSDIQAEVMHAIQTKSWTASLSTIFFVFTPLNVYSCFDSSQSSCSFTGSNGYCAYHGVFGAVSQPIIYANMPDAWTDLASCGTTTSPNNDAGADSTINVTSHEHFEAVSDPEINAWYDVTGAEIGDKCAWTFAALSGAGADVSLNGDPYILQQEWSNAGSQCVISYGAGVGVSASLSTVSASPSSVAADDSTSSTVTVTLKNASGNAVAGKSVSLSQGSGHSAITTISGTTNSSGVAGFSVKDGTAETVTYRATDTSDSIVLTQTAAVAFTSASQVGAMTLGGTLNKNIRGTMTLTADVGGSPCSGASVNLTNTSAFSNLVLASSCGSGAVTLFLNSRAAGLRTSSGATCLPFAAGTSVSALTVIIGGLQDSSCATGGGGGGPTVPAAPGNVAAVAGNGSATVSWTAPSDGGSSITGYTVTATPAGGTSPVQVGGATVSTLVTGLTNGVSYTFSVTATNSVGTSPPATSNAVTPSGGSGGGAPMTLSGRLSTFSYGTSTISASVGGAPCDGASVSITYSSMFTGLAIPGSCGSGAVTLSVNGTAAGLLTSSKATCLPFTSGGSASVTVIVGGRPNTSC